MEIAPPVSVATSLPSDSPRVPQRTRRGISALAILTIGASGLNYASNLIFSRLLDPVGFGELTALLALAVIVVVPTAAAQTVIAERITTYVSTGDLPRAQYFVRHAIAHVSVIACVVGLIYALCIPVIITALDLRQPGPAVALGLFIILAFLQPVALGVLQGMERFAAFGAMQLAIATSRIAFGVPWVLAGGGAGGAIAGQAFGVAVVLVGTAWLLRDLILSRGSGAATTGLKRKPDIRTVHASMAFVAFAVLSNLDLLLATLFLPPDEVGMYAAITTVGKLVMFLPMAISVVLVPDATKSRGSVAGQRQVLRRSAALVFATAGAAALPAIVAPSLLIRVMFGPGYEEATGGVLPIVIAGAALSMLYLLVVYAVTISDRRWTVVLALGVALQVIGIATFHGSPVQVATVQAVVTLVVLAVNESWFHAILRRPRVPA